MEVHQSFFLPWLEYNDLPVNAWKGIIIFNFIIIFFNFTAATAADRPALSARAGWKKEKKVICIIDYLKLQIIDNLQLNCKP